MRIRLAHILILALVASYVVAGAPKKPKSKGASVREQGLVLPRDIASNSILRNHKSMNQQFTKSFENPSLGFVTPWNNYGYNIAKLLNAKFTYISPVWYQIVPNNGKFALQGQHDVDQGWIREVRTVSARTESPPPKIVPRILFEGWSENDYYLIGRDPRIMNSIVELVFEECNKQDFDGFVLDFSYVQFGGYGGAIRYLIKNLGYKFHEAQKEIILVVPPYFPQHSFFTAEDYNFVFNYVDQILIMTYDYSSNRRVSAEGGPSAPTNWMLQSVLQLLPPSSRANENNKLLLGLNFYGVTFCSEGNAPIVGNQFLELIETFRPTLKWSSEYEEHYFTYKHDELTWTAYFPTLKYIDARLDLARSLGVGIGIWEIGQGLDYFYDLL